VRLIPGVFRGNTFSFPKRNTGIVEVPAQLLFRGKIPGTIFIF
jgi:hypothetical protein